MHCSVSGCGDVLVKTEEEAIDARRAATSRYLPGNHRGSRRPTRRPRRRAPAASASTRSSPRDENKPFDMHALIDALVDEGSFLEIKKLFAAGAHHRARAHRRARGGHRRQPAASTRAACCSWTRADKAARFIWLCDAFNIPLLYLADVPGFMIGTKVERAGIIRAGAKMIAAVSEATRAEDLRGRAQGLRRGPLRDVRPGLRARRLPRAAPGVDRGDGPGGGGERRLLQQDPGEAGGRARGLRRAAARRVPRPTSTSTSSPASWWSTRSCPASSCAPSSPQRFALYYRADAARRAEKKHGVYPV